MDKITFEKEWILFFYAEMTDLLTLIVPFLMNQGEETFFFLRVWLCRIIVEYIEINTIM